MDWNFGWDNIATIGVALLVMLGLWKRAKSIIRELAEALMATSNAIEDDDVDMNECRRIVDSFWDVILAARGKLKG